MEVDPPPYFKWRSQLLNGPTLTLNSVLMSLEYDLYHSGCYTAYAVFISCHILISQSAVNCSLTFRFLAELLRINVKKPSVL